MDPTSGRNSFLKRRITMQRTFDIPLSGVQTANYLAISTQTLASLCRQRKIPYTGSQPRRYRLGDIIEYRDLKNAADEQHEALIATA